MRNHINDYIRNLGIDVEYNTLGHTQQLVDAYVVATTEMVDTSQDKKSHFIKHACYSTFYPFENREKLTGFENFKTIDKLFRRKQSPNIDFMRGGISHVVDASLLDTTGDYKDLLENSMKSCHDPIVLYLSGGLDSEFVANALLAANIAFTPVIFNWSDNSGEIKNGEDTKYAFEFCTKNSLTPIVKTVNLEELWASDEFCQLSTDAELISTQLVTHVYMVKLISSEMSNCKHLLGGEVRYKTDYLNDDGTLAHLVSLDKVTPGYNALNYTVDTVANTLCACRLRYYNDGSWHISFNGDVFNGAGHVISGTWIVPPSTTYQYRITNLYVYNWDSPGGVYYTAVPDLLSVPTAWAAIGSNTLMCQTSMSVKGRYIGTIYTIQVRSPNSPSTIVETTIDFELSTAP